MILQRHIDKYSIKEPPIEGCVYRITYGGKYIIVKGKTLAGSLFQVQKGHGWYTDKVKGALYGHFYKHINDTPNKRFYVRVLLQSNNPYELLKREQKELDMGRHNPSMLNNSQEAYIPVFNESTNMHGWIGKSYVLNFQKHLKSPTRAAALKKYKRLSLLKLAKHGSLSHKD